MVFDIIYATKERLFKWKNSGWEGVTRIYAAEGEPLTAATLERIKALKTGEKTEIFFPRTKNTLVLKKVIG